MPNSVRTPGDVSVAGARFDAACVSEAAIPRARNASLLRTVFLRSSAPLLSFGWMLVGDRRVAEHLVEHAFLHVWRTRLDLATERELVPELYRSVVEAAFGRAGRAAHGDGASAAPAEDDVVARIRHALGRLSFRHRAAFLLGRVPGLADADIATWLGVPSARLKELVLEAAHELIEELGGCLDDASHDELQPREELRTYGSARRR